MPRLVSSALGWQGIATWRLYENITVAHSLEEECLYLLISMHSPLFLAPCPCLCQRAAALSTTLQSPFPPTVLAFRVTRLLSLLLLLSSLLSLFGHGLLLALPISTELADNWRIQLRARGRREIVIPGGCTAQNKWPAVSETIEICSDQNEQLLSSPLTSVSCFSP